MRDRLADLNARRLDAGDGSYELSINGGVFMEDFFRTVEEVSRALEIISSQVNEVKKKHITILSAPNRDERTKEELEVLTANIRKNVNFVRLKLKTMQQTLPPDSSHASVDVRIQRCQYTVLSRRFMEVITQYNETQLDFRERCKRRIQRQLEITGRMTTCEELEAMLESEHPSVFISNIISDTQITRQALNEIESRHKDILRLETSIKELHEMFMNMAMFLAQQGDVVNNIENNVSQAVDYVAKAEEQFEKIVTIQKKTRGRKMYLFIALLVLGLVIVIIISGLFA